MNRLKPSATLDAEISRDFFGWEDSGNGKWRMNKVGEGTVVGSLPPYSSDRDTAQAIKTKLKLEYAVDISKHPGPSEYFCTITKHDGPFEMTFAEDSEALALCAAAKYVSAHRKMS